ncbi:Xaa-Pro peptidase family protein [bacterium]|nr:Xaa-Pro peptidase family protein [bacterium]
MGHVDRKTQRRTETRQAREKELRTRVTRVARTMKRALGGRKNAMLVVSSAIPQQKARDLTYPFHQDDDFWYLTDSQIERANLVVFSDGRRPALVVPRLTEHDLVWESISEQGRTVAKRIGAELLTTDDPLKELRTFAAEHEILYFPNGNGQTGHTLAKELLAEPSHRRRRSPILLGHTDHILEPLRLLKSPFEVARIREAIEISASALHEVTPLLRPGMREHEISRALRHALEDRGSSESFPTIVASGPNGAILHHTPGERKLVDGDLLTIDFGGICRGYAADVTRVFPIGDAQPKKLREVHHLLLEIQEEIVSRVKPGILWKTLNEETHELLLRGLRSLKVLRGTLPELRKKNATKRFLPHSLGHSLGIAVHDIGPVRATGECSLEPGMVVTVEPGIYSRTAVGTLAPFGIRIEDDILVTKSGHKNLSAGIPKLRPTDGR